MEGKDSDASAPKPNDEQTKEVTAPETVTEEVKDKVESDEVTPVEIVNSEVQELPGPGPRPAPAPLPAPPPPPPPPPLLPQPQSQPKEEPPLVVINDDEPDPKPEGPDRINSDDLKENLDKCMHKHGEIHIERDKIIQHRQLEQKPRIIVKHSILGNRIPSHDQNVLVESSPFTSLGKIQPFLITFSSNAALVMDFHCHLTTSEVVGYLAGNWDVNTHNLNITHAFPCKCRLGDFESAPVVENEIRKVIKSNRLTVVGWYHSHPTAPPAPSLRDIDTQLDYELRMKGNTDSTYLPCIGMICSPYNVDNPSFESNIACFWVIPPPENKIHEYGKPMMMSYSMVQDQAVTHEVLLEMKKCADFYKPEKDFIIFDETLKGSSTYLDKMKVSLTAKFPLNLQKVDTLWNYVQDIISKSNEKPETDILKEIIDISNTPVITPVINNEKPSTKFSVPTPPSPLSFKHAATTTTTSGVMGATTTPGGATVTLGTSNNGNGSNNGSSLAAATATTGLPYQKTHSKTSKSSSSKRPSGISTGVGSGIRDSKNLASLSNYFVGSDLATALFGSGKFPMGLDPATKSLLNLNSLSLSNMFLPPMAAYKPDAGLGLMKPPPPPPSTYYPYASPRGSRSSPSSSPSSSSVSPSSMTASTSSSSTNRGQSRTSLPSTSRDMPPPNKVPKLDVHQMANFFIPPNLGKNCTITSRPSTSTK